MHHLFPACAEVVMPHPAAPNPSRWSLLGASQEVSKQGDSQATEVGDDDDDDGADSQAQTSSVYVSTSIAGVALAFESYRS